jgi:hypothetical protein
MAQTLLILKGETMIIRLHRWQPRANRNRTEVINLAEREAGPFLDLIFRRGASFEDKTIKQAIMRTQQVDRIQFTLGDDPNYPDPSVDVYLSPIVDRKYTRKAIAEVAPGVRKPRATDHRCKCHHLEEDHAKEKVYNSRGGIYSARYCFIPGCACRDFVPLEVVQLPAASGSIEDIFNNPPVTSTTKEKQ